VRARDGVRKLLRFLARHRRRISPLLILPHDYPDPDSLACASALKLLAEERYGIAARIAYGGVLGRMENREMVRTLRIPLRKLRKGDLERQRHVVLVDTQPSFQNNSFPADRKATIVIDQHGSEGKVAAELAIIDTGCGATSAILARALRAARVEVPPRVATALVYGILSDTSNFSRARTRELISTYLELVPSCDFPALARIQEPSRPRSFFVTLATALREATVRGSAIVSHLGRVPNPDSVSLVADFLLTYRGMRWSLCTGRYRDTLHVSLRADRRRRPSPADLLRFALRDRGGAGGHDTIAGGQWRLDPGASDPAWARAERGVEEAVLRGLRNRARGSARPFRRKR